MDRIFGYEPDDGDSISSGPARVLPVLHLSHDRQGKGGDLDLLRVLLLRMREKMYRVYWTAQDGQACSQDYLDMISALTETNRLRALGRAYVTMVGENANQVGKMGATGVESGRLPDGEEYTWSKRR